MTPTPAKNDIPYIQDAIETVLKAGYVVLEPNPPLEYGVSWDDRMMTITQKKDRATAMADEQAASQPGRWKAVQRVCGPWEDLPSEVKK